MISSSLKPLVFLIGQSGAGISTAARALQDLGFFVVDNLPFHLVATMVKDLEESAAGQNYPGYAIGVHTYCSPDAASLQKVVGKLAGQYQVDVMFFTAATQMLEQRFSVTRRPHPLLSSSPSLRGSIEKEKKLLTPLKEHASRLIDTTHFTPTSLAHWVRESYLSGSPQHKMLLLLSSFGFKYQMPLPADIIFDARFLKNPYFKPHLRHLTGCCAEVKAYIQTDERYAIFLGHIKSFLHASLPFYRAEGRCYLRIGIGCTGGVHRSVATVEHLAHHFKEQADIKGVVVEVTHRDLPAASQQP